VLKLLHLYLLCTQFIPNFKQ